MDFAKGKSHAQDGERLPVAAVPQPETASSDPAMAFELPRTTGKNRPVSNGQQPRCRMNSGMSAPQRANRPRRKRSTADPEPFNQRLVAGRVDASEVVEQLTTLRYELEQTTPGMIVFD